MRFLIDRDIDMTINGYAGTVMHRVGRSAGRRMRRWLGG
jgi:hypothetical protein